MARKVRVAVIGCGNVSQGHIPAWQGRPREAQIVGLFDPVREFCEKRRDQFHLDGARLYDSYEQALDDPAVDVVNLCSMSDLHDEQIMRAMEAGKHVLTEKPTGYSLENCRKLRWYAKRYPKILVAVAYSLRYYPINIEVKRLIGAGAIGRPMWGNIEHNHLMHGAALPPDTHRADAVRGDLSDSGGRYIAGSELCDDTHPYDLARHLMGEPWEVYATRNGCATSVTITGVDSSLCHVTGGRVSKAGLRMVCPVMIQGTEGTLYTMWLPPAKGKPPAYVGFLLNEDRKGAKVRPIRAGQDTGHGDRTRVENFLAAMRGKAPLICPLEDSVLTSELLHAIKTSFTLGIRVHVERRTRTG